MKSSLAGVRCSVVSRTYFCKKQEMAKLLSFRQSPDKRLGSLFKLNVGVDESPQPPDGVYGHDENLNSLRNCIDAIDDGVWKKVRWAINPYDFAIDSETGIINRAFFKLWEISREHSVYPLGARTVLHLAEAPGGFIQVTNEYYGRLVRCREAEETRNQGADSSGTDGFTPVKAKTKRKIKLPEIYTMSLNKMHETFRSYNLPSYNQKVLKDNVKITYGVDRTGDLCNPQNVHFLSKMLVGKYPEFITADGGFDEGNDFNHKEQLHYKLFLAEIMYCLALLCPGGNFVLKMFDTFTETSVHMLYLLTHMFQTVHIHKPKTSRPTNSEKYIICSNFMLSSKQRCDVSEKLMTLFRRILDAEQKQRYVSFSLFARSAIPTDFIERVAEINRESVAVQCEFLREAITLCNNRDFMTSFEQNIETLLKDRHVLFREWKRVHEISL